MTHYTQTAAESLLILMIGYWANDTRTTTPFMALLVILLVLVTLI